MRCDLDEEVVPGTKGEPTEKADGKQCKKNEKDLHENQTTNSRNNPSRGGAVSSSELRSPGFFLRGHRKESGIAQFAGAHRSIPAWILEGSMNHSRIACSSFNLAPVTGFFVFIISMKASKR